MRRIVMFNHVTADGYFAGPDGNLDWVVRDEQVDNRAASCFATRPRRSRRDRARRITA
jgi:hypothetical protein